MKTYEIIILGSGYTSLGIASKVENSLVIEKNECLDGSFCLPLKGYAHTPYTPTLSGAKRLKEIFGDLHLFNGNFQNVNGFDVALCTYAREKGIDILLKTAVLSVESCDQAYLVTVQNNGGIKTYRAKRVIDTRGEKSAPFYTVLFTGTPSDKALVEKTFNASVEKAYHEGWYALKFPASGFDVNDVKLFVYEKWNTCAIQAKILYMPPEFSYGSSNPLCDDYYRNPIEAFAFGEGYL